MKATNKILTNLLCFCLSTTFVMAFRAASRYASTRSIATRYTIPATTAIMVPSSKRFFMASNSNSNSYEKEFQQKQRILSESLQEKDQKASASQIEHTKHQAKVFDEMARFFNSNQATPPEVVPILTKMADSMIDDMIQQRQEGAALERPARVNSTYTEDVYHILDVGCGTGALFEFYLKAAAKKLITIHIQGLDLAPKMVEKAQENGKKLLESHPSHSIQVRVGDICEDQFLASDAVYDLVVANACFGNFWDRSKALQGMAQSLRLDGVLCIAHPLGSEFVQQLHDEDSQTVPHLLPTLPEFEKLARTLPLLVQSVVDKDAASFYKGTAVKVVHRTLPETMRLRGTVDSGYGRGGKKLGFPTANLPSGLFQGALQDVPCGVYFGWAVLEGGDDKKGRNVPHKAVVNVGFSPTFEGQENKEKIVEAHLMLEDKSVLDPPDFYGEVMRLQLVGFIRSEMKFPSFPALIAQISTDVEDAKDALDLEKYQKYKSDLFVANAARKWVGRGGGDEAASWEFEDVEEVLDKL